MRESSLDYLSLSFTHSLVLSLFHSHSHSRSRKEHVSPLSREAANPPGDNHVLARPRPNFDLKFLHGFYPKIYIHIYDRCIRNATSLQRTSLTDSGCGYHQQTGLTDPRRLSPLKRSRYLSCRTISHNRTRRKKVIR